MAIFDYDWTLGAQLWKSNSAIKFLVAYRINKKRQAPAPTSPSSHAACHDPCTTPSSLQYVTAENYLAFLRLARGFVSFPLPGYPGRQSSYFRQGNWVQPREARTAQVRFPAGWLEYIKNCGACADIYMGFIGKTRRLTKWRDRIVSRS